MCVVDPVHGVTIFNEVGVAAESVTGEAVLTATTGLASDVAVLTVSVACRLARRLSCSLVSSTTPTAWGCRP